MADLKPVGSEKLPLNSKIRRIVELANYGNKKDVSENSYQTVVYNKRGADGNVYAIIKENSNYIIKKGKSEGSLDYLNGLNNSKKNTFSSYSKALKKLNLMFKPLNEEFNGRNENPLIGEQKKFVLKNHWNLHEIYKVLQNFLDFFDLNHNVLINKLTLENYLMR